jgi:hypothetical protein
MALTLNTDFKCSGSPETCTASNENASASFKFLQSVLNRYYTVGQFSLLKVDGRLNNKTLIAAQSVGKWLIDSVGTSEITSNTLIRNAAWATGLGNIAAYSRELGLLLDDLANQQRLPLEPPNSNTIWWVAAGAAVAFAAGSIYAIWRTRKSAR